MASYIDRKVCLVLISVAAASMLPAGAKAQSAGSGGGSQSATDEPLSDLMTTSTVRNIQSVETECLHRDPIYQLDCLRQGLELVWRRLPYHGDYGTMRAAIQESTNALATVVESDADRATPRLDSGLSSNPRFQARRHYTATLGDKLSSAQSATRQILGQLSDVLARANGNSTTWSDNYSTVAKAIRQVSTAL